MNECLDLYLFPLTRDTSQMLVAAAHEQNYADVGLLVVVVLSAIAVDAVLMSVLLPLCGLGWLISKVVP